MPVETSGVPTYEQPYRMGGIEPRARVAAIDALATADETRVFIHAINRSFDEPAEIAIDLTGFPAGDRAIHHLVQGRLNDAPEEGQSEQIGRESASRITGSTKMFRVKLPERSVSCIEVPLERTGR